MMCPAFGEKSECQEIMDDCWATRKDTPATLLDSIFLGVLRHCTLTVANCESS